MTILRGTYSRSDIDVKIHSDVIEVGESLLESLSYIICWLETGALINPGKLSLRFGILNLDGKFP